MRKKEDFTLANVTQGYADVKYNGKTIGAVYFLSGLPADERHYTQHAGWYGQIGDGPRRMSDDPCCKRSHAASDVVSAYKKATSQVETKTKTDHRDCQNCSPARPYCVWTLAPDDAGDERGHIIVTDNGETEVTGVIVEHSDALMIASAFNALHELGVPFRDSVRHNQR